MSEESDSEGEEDNSFSFTPRGHSKPEDMTPPVAAPAEGPTRLLFQMQVMQHPVDFLLQQHGLLPTEDLRLTVALALNAQTSMWLDSIVRRIAESVLNNN